MSTARAPNLALMRAAAAPLTIESTRKMVNAHEMIATLETSHVRYVVWDQYWVNDWGEGGRHLLNKPLTDYLLSRFHTEAMVGPFHILARSD